MSSILGSVHTVPIFVPLFTLLLAKSNDIRDPIEPNATYSQAIDAPLITWVYAALTSPMDNEPARLPIRHFNPSNPSTIFHDAPTIPQRIGNAA